MIKISLAFADVDGDGDFDALVGSGMGHRLLDYLENTGSATDALFERRTEEGHPFFNVVQDMLNFLLVSGGRIRPTFGDVGQCCPVLTSDPCLTYFP